MSVVASRKVNFIVLRVRNALYITRLFIIGTIRGVTSGERFKKNFYCGVYEVISLRKWPSCYGCELSTFLTGTLDGHFVTRGSYDWRVQGQT